MRLALRTAFALAAALLISAAQAQYPTPRINEKGPDKLVPPTPTVGFQPKDPGERGPKVLPPTPTSGPTRTPTPTPVPPDQRFAGPRWGTDQYLLAIRMTRLDAQSRCKSAGDFLNGGRVRLSVDCAFLGNGPFGLKADFEVANGLRLRNGWKVKSFEMNSALGTEPAGTDSHHGFNVTKTPVIGSDNPEFSVHLFAELTKAIVVEGGVLIEGPHGTTPW
jgi:hypothetical protein